MKPRHWLLIILFAAVTSFCFGRGYQHLKAGHFYEVYDEESKTGDFGPVVLRHELDNIGLPFLDGSYSTIALKTGFGEVLVYKSQVGFQESYPHVKKIEVSGDRCLWEDGWCKYELRLTPLRNEWHKTESSNTQAAESMAK